MSKIILLITSSFEKVSLITASSKQLDGFKTNDHSHYPLGIAYLHSYLEAKDHNVESLWLNHFDDVDEEKELIKKKIIEINPEIIGFQILTPNRISSFRLISWIHKEFSNIQIIAGGIHATCLYESILKKFPYLIIVLGEGELTLAELADKTSYHESILKDIEGIAYSSNGTVLKTNRRQIIQNIDILPTPKHELFFTPQRVNGSILTSRGCSFSCSFCSLDQISQRKVRYRSVKNVIDEIDSMVKQFPQMKQIWIHDDSFFINNKRVIEICEEIIKKKYSVDFVCSGRAKPISKEMVEKLEMAKFSKVMLGLESGDDGILKKSGKLISGKDVLNALHLFASTKISIYAFLIVGLPGETKQTIKNTISLVQKMQKIKYIEYYDSVAILTVYPGTAIYEIAKEKKIVNDEFWFEDVATPLFTVENSVDKLFEYKEYLLNHISSERFFTCRGFFAQIKMIPYFINYDFLNNNVKKFRWIISKNIKRILPDSIYSIIYRVYHKSY